jgi:hypothetical protein
VHEYASVTHASPEALADELTRRAADGWEVVSVVPTQDGRFCAFLRRRSRATTAAATAEMSGAAATATVATAGLGATTSAAATPPADWYADPSGRFELRYWNGREWTEHVARGGRQSVDPPRA